MRKSVMTGILTCALILGLSKTASAEVNHNNLNKSVDSQVIALLSEKESKLVKIIVDQSNQVEKVADVVPVPQMHKVEQGESLDIIATKHGTTWKRIYDKNSTVIDPNVIHIGEMLAIPKPEETIAERALPLPPKPVVVEPIKIQKRSVAPQVKQVKSTVATPVAQSSGNRYSSGYCTWYVKNQRPDLPNNLGNAATWVTRAAAQGLPTGSTPRAGAVGQRANHVVFVESVNADGTITISEMNYRNLNERTVRTLPANYFQYIY